MKWTHFIPKFCVNLFVQDGFECQCCPGFIGPHCEEQDACYPSPCQNHGICVDISQGHDGTTFQCLCPYGNLVIKLVSSVMSCMTLIFIKKKKAHKWKYVPGIQLYHLIVVLFVDSCNFMSYIFQIGTGQICKGSFHNTI